MDNGHEPWEGAAPDRVARIDRRLLQRGLMLGLGLPAVSLLAACGGDDDEATAPSTTPTAAGTQPMDETTPTEAPVENTPAGELDEPSPTSDGEEATATSAGEPAAPPSGGTFVEGGDPLMGQEYEPGTPGGIFVEAWASDVNFATGWATTQAWNAKRLLFEGLIETNPFSGYEPVGELAVAWEVSEDATLWTFFLREGVLFHDGEPFTAEDVVVSYAYQMDEAVGGSAFTVLTETIASIEQVDEYTVAFTTNDVSPDFLLATCLRLVAAAHIISQFEPADFNASPAGTGDDPAYVVGTGPFRFRELVTDDYITLDRFDGYWNGSPYVDSHIFRDFADGQAATTALLAGEIDYIWEILLTDRERLEEAGFILREWQILGFDAVVLNLDPERTPLFQDVRVRQALMHALDREAMLEVAYSGFGEVARVLVGRGTALANPDGITVHYPHDPEQAMALLDEAGWVVGDDGVREKDGQRFSFVLTGAADWEPLTDQATMVQEMWRTVGIEVELNLVPYDMLWELAPEHDFDAICMDPPTEATSDRTFLYSCAGSSNFMGYCNPEVDALLEEARIELDQEHRIALYTEFQNLVWDELPLLPTVSSNGITATNPRVHNPSNCPLLTNMWYGVNKVWLEQ
jgi:peptide/nickel transport system substrate-binding protein